MSSKRFDRFSLIELLIVVAIILILLSIIQPALRQAITNAKLVGCMNQLRNNGFGLQIYSDDNNGFYPKGNAGIIWGYGYGSTYVTSPAAPTQLQETAMGLFIIYVDEYLNTPENMYCPIWDHPYYQMNTKTRTHSEDPIFGAGQIGGYAAKGHPERPSWIVGMSYAYRGTMGPTFREPPNPKKDEPTTAVLADHFSRREVLWGEAFGHPNSYNTLYLDGSTKRKEDPGHFWMKNRQPHSHDLDPQEIHSCGQYTNGAGTWPIVERIFQDFFENDDI